MKRSPVHLLAALLLALSSPSAVASIGEEANTILTALAERGVEVVAVGGSYLGTVDATAGTETPFTFEERGGVVYRVEGSASVVQVVGDPAAGFLAELIGASTVYGEQLIEPVRTFFETRLGELAGQGPVSLGVEEYLLTLTVQAATLPTGGPYQVDFSLALQEVEASRFPAAVHAIGPADARYVIREFSDFQCPFCANFNGEVLSQIEAAIERGEGPWAQVRFEFHHFPLQSIHANAMVAAEASECVTAANDPAAFWTFHDGLFERQAAWQSLGDPGPYFVRLAQELGLTSDGLATCLSERTYLPAVDRAYRAAASDLRLSGTPTIFVNGFKVRDYLSLTAFEALFEQSDRFAQP